MITKVPPHTEAVIEASLRWALARVMARPVSSDASPFRLRIQSDGPMGVAQAGMRYAAS
jgi:hypothetical protein